MPHPKQWMLDMPDHLQDAIFGPLSRQFGTDLVSYISKSPFMGRDIRIELVLFKPADLSNCRKNAQLAFANLARTEQASRDQIARWLPDFALESGYALKTPDDCAEWLELRTIFARQDTIELHFRFLPDPETLFRMMLIDGKPSIYVDIEH